MKKRSEKKSKGSKDMLFQMNLHIAFLVLVLPLTYAEFYVQDQTQTHYEVCPNSQVTAGSKIGCTLKCKHRLKKALFTREKKCFCIDSSTVTVEKVCGGTKKLKIKGNVLEHHEIKKCPFGYSGDKCAQYVGEGLSWTNPASSCKQIKERFRDANSGFYWVQFPDKSVRVYCDMVTDGGGWLLIGNITTTSDSQASSRTYTEARSFRYNTLSELHKGEAVLDGSLFPALSVRMGWTQFRIFCTKPYHKRVFHVINRITARGYAFRDYILGKDVTWLTKPEDCKEAIAKLPDDNSYLSQACMEESKYIRSQVMKGKDARLYDHVLFEHGNAHVQLFDNDRLECDDFQPKHALSGTYDQIGKWMYFVR